MVFLRICMTRFQLLCQKINFNVEDGHSFFMLELRLLKIESILSTAFLFHLPSVPKFLPGGRGGGRMVSFGTSVQLYLRGVVLYQYILQFSDRTNIEDSVKKKNINVQWRKPNHVFFDPIFVMMNLSSLEQIIEKIRFELMNENCINVRSLSSSLELAPNECWFDTR